MSSFALDVGDRLSAREHVHLLASIHAHLTTSMPTSMGAAPRLWRLGVDIGCYSNPLIVSVLDGF